MIEQNIFALCQDAIPGFLGLFDLSIAPKLLYYAYIPAIIISVFFAFVILWRDHFSRVGWAFLATTVTFSAWLVNEIIQWIAVYHIHILGSWQASMFIESLFFLAVSFTFASFIRESKALRYITLLNIFISLGVFFLIKSPLNIASYNAIDCEGIAGVLWNFFYGYQFFVLILAWYFGRKALKQTTGAAQDSSPYRTKVLWGIILLFALFLGTNIVSELTGFYNLNILIPIGMISCVILIAFPAVEHPIFSFQFYRSEVLIYSAVALVGSLLLIPDVISQKIVIMGTLIALFLLGKSVIAINKREQKQRGLLDTLNKRLTMLDAKKNEFLSFATHQLRSPLTSIKWGLDSLKDNYNPDTVKTLRATVEDLVSTVNDLLDISKIEQGGLVMKLEKINLGDFIKRITDEFDMTAKNKGLALMLNDTTNNCMLSADPTKLRQVFVNIIDNAIKYTASGTITVSVVQESKQAVITISDTGPGIAATELAGLFNKFARGDAGNKSKGGSGLGLYLARKIIEVLHGEIEADSEGLGKGSSFTVKLPLV